MTEPHSPCRRLGGRGRSRRRDVPSTPVSEPGLRTAHPARAGLLSAARPVLPALQAPGRTALSLRHLRRQLLAPDLPPRLSRSPARGQRPAVPADDQRGRLPAGRPPARDGRARRAAKAAEGGTDARLPAWQPLSVPARGSHLAARRGGDLRMRFDPTVDDAGAERLHPSHQFSCASSMARTRAVSSASPNGFSNAGSSACSLPVSTR